MPGETIFGKVGGERERSREKDLLERGDLAGLLASTVDSTVPRRLILSAEGVADEGAGREISLPTGEATDPEKITAALKELYPDGKIPVEGKFFEIQT